MGTLRPQSSAKNRSCSLCFYVAPGSCLPRTRKPASKRPSTSTPSRFDTGLLGKKPHPSVFPSQVARHVRRHTMPDSGHCLCSACLVNKSRPTNEHCPEYSSREG